MHMSTRPRKERSSEKKESKELTCGKTERKKARTEPVMAVQASDSVKSGHLALTCLVA